MYAIYLLFCLSSLNFKLHEGKDLFRVTAILICLRLRGILGCRTSGAKTRNILGKLGCVDPSRLPYLFTIRPHYTGKWANECKPLPGGILQCSVHCFISSPEWEVGFAVMSILQMRSLRLGQLVGKAGLESRSASLQTQTLNCSAVHTSQLLSALLIPTDPCPTQVGGNWPKADHS